MPAGCRQLLSGGLRVFPRQAALVFKHFLGKEAKMRGDPAGVGHLGGRHWMSLGAGWPWLKPAVLIPLV